MSRVKDEVRAFLDRADPAQLVWNVVGRLPTFSFASTRARLLAMVGADIRRGSAVMGHIRIVGPRGAVGKLQIGRGTLIGPNVTACLDAPICIGENVSIGPQVMLYTATHPLGLGSRRMQLDVLARPIVVEDGAWIGLGATILPGVRVGRGAVVAAGAVVAKDVPDNALVAGNPAVLVDQLPEH